MPDQKQIQETIVNILEEMTEDWDLDLDGIDSETTLSDDLCFSSVDALNLMAMIDVRFQRKLKYEKLIMRAGQYVEDLTVQNITEFVRDHFDDQVTNEPSPM